MRGALDREAAAAVEAAERRGRPSVHLLPLAEGRRCYAEESAPVGGVAGLRHVEELRLGSGPRARLYRPASGTLPVVLFFHGGGWVLGSVDTHDRMCRALAQTSGCAVLSVDYRLAPEHPYPAAVDDAADALAWVAASGTTYDLDVRRLAVAGDSAGGNIATALALRTAGGDIRPALQVLFYPVTTTDLEVGVDPRYDGLVLCREELAWHQSHYLPRPEQRRRAEASPLDRADLTGMPPAVVLVAECDPIAPQSIRYVEALRSAGVPAELRTYRGMTHGFAQYPDRFRAARTALADAGTALAAALGQPAAPSHQRHPRARNQPGSPCEAPVGKE